MLGARYAVLIANSVFPKEPQLQLLRCPEKDVDGLEVVLRSSERGGFSDVSVLKNRPHHEIASNIHRVLRRAGKDDLVVVYYSGHGKLNQSGQLYLAAYDTEVSELESSAVAVGRIRDFVEVSQSRQLVIILDCCYSGAIAKIFSKSSVDDQIKIEANKGRGMYVMTASTGIQTALEKEADQYSVFTKHLIAGIETGEADTNSNGVITIEDLYNYLYPRVCEESHQEPTRWNVDTRGQLIIANSGRHRRNERKKVLRNLLLDLSREERITDEILVDALAVISLPAENLSPTNQARHTLLDELHDGKISPVSFLVKWVEMKDVQDNMSAAKNVAINSRANFQATANDQTPKIEISSCFSSAEPVNAKAQFNPDFMYENGQGVSKDEAQAIETGRESKAIRSSGARSETGYVREENQDRMSSLVAKFGNIYVVSDGSSQAAQFGDVFIVSDRMGGKDCHRVSDRMRGHQWGGLAAELTTEILGQTLSVICSLSNATNALKAAFEEANGIVYERAHFGDERLQDMRAAAVVLLISHSQAIVAHVGHSRAYLFRGGELHRLTKDHSPVQRMVDAGMLTDAEAMYHPAMGELERAIGVSPSVEVEISPTLELNGSELFLLCSDGLHGYVSDSEIAAILKMKIPMQSMADELVSLALGKGGEDNITVQLVGNDPNRAS